MEKRRVLRTCIFSLVLALTLRLGGSMATLPEEIPIFLLYLETGRLARMPKSSLPEPELPELPELPEVLPTQISFPHLDFPDPVEVKLDGSYAPDMEALLQLPVDLDFSGPEPRILILHTHTCESYTPEPGWEYESAGNFRTLDREHSVCRVGAEIAGILEEAGISVIHDTEYNDYPSYNGSYDRALERIEAHLKAHPTIQMVIDVHRDALELEDGTQIGTEAQVDGKPSCQLMLVLGSDEGGLSHPHWEQNLSWGLKIQAQTDRLYPGLCRPLFFCGQRYNEHSTPGSILLEVGTAGDTLSEALTAGAAFANSLVSLISGLGLAE